MFVGLIILTFYWALSKTATHRAKSLSVIPGIYFLCSTFFLVTTSNSLTDNDVTFYVPGRHQCLSKMKFIFYLNCYLTRANYKLTPRPALASSDAECSSLSPEWNWQDSKQTVWHIWALIWREFPWTENPELPPETNKAACRPDHTPDTAWPTEASKCFCSRSQHSHK